MFFTFVNYVRQLGQPLGIFDCYDSMVITIISSSVTFILILCNWLHDWWSASLWNGLSMYGSLYWGHICEPCRMCQVIWNVVRRWKHKIRVLCNTVTSKWYIRVINQVSQGTCVLLWLNLLLHFEVTFPFHLFIYSEVTPVRSVHSLHVHTFHHSVFWHLMRVVIRWSSRNSWHCTLFIRNILCENPVIIWILPSPG